MNHRLSLIAFCLVPLSLACGYYNRGGYYHGGGNGSGNGTAGGSGGNPSANPSVGDACDIDASSDWCARGGLACMPVLADGGTVCQVPGEFYDCDSDVGCATGLGCHYGVCLESCSTTADCWDPLTTCAPYQNVGNQCIPNPCGGADNLGVWQACGASSPDAGDGTCVPLDANASATGCQQGGTVALGGACQLNRADGGPGFCAPGLLCMLDASGANAGICLPVCNGFGGPGPSCASGSSCVPTTLALQPSAVSALEYYSLSGACAQSCSVGAGSSDAGITSDAGLDDGGADGGSDGATDGGCPAPTSCMNGSLTSTAVFVCLP